MVKCWVNIIVLAKHDFEKENVFVKTTDGHRVSLSLLYYFDSAHVIPSFRMKNIQGTKKQFLSTPIL